MGLIIRGFIWDIPILIFAYVLFWGPNLEPGVRLPLLGGSWAGRSGVIRPLIWIMIMVTLLITPLTSTYTIYIICETVPTCSYRSDSCLSTRTNFYLCMFLACVSFVAPFGNLRRIFIALETC